MRSRFLWGCLFGLVGCGGSTPPPDAGVPSGDAGCVPFDAGGLDPAVVTAGGKLIVQYRCQQCHGQSLSGNPDGVQVSGTHLLQYPPNLTGDPETGLGCWSNAEISRAVLDGVDNEGAAMCGPMPHLRSAGASVSDVDAMVAFLRSLPVYSIAVPEAPACACATNADCPPFERCSADQACVCDTLDCAFGKGDAGVADGGGFDGGAHGGHDGGVHDGGVHDAGFDDAGTDDAGLVDAGLTDAGPDDGGLLDGGASPDAGSTDDAGSDAGLTDDGGLDAGGG
jgi:hypothetical protein